MTTEGISSSHPRGLQLAAGTTGCGDWELDADWMPPLRIGPKERDSGLGRLIFRPSRFFHWKSITERRRMGRKRRRRKIIRKRRRSG